MTTSSPFINRLDPVRVAVVQGTPRIFDVSGTLEKVRGYASDASRQGAKLCVFPEAFVSGYPRGFNFDSPIDVPDPAPVTPSPTAEELAILRDEVDPHRYTIGRSAPAELRHSGHFVTYWQSAIEVPGPAVDTLAGIARETSQYLVVGVTERERGTLYCTALFFAPDGTLLGKHRKLMPTGNERMYWGFGDGSTLPVFKTEIGNIGAALCYENYMPLLRTKMYADGITIYCAPTAASGEVWAGTMQHIAMEGGCFVLGCNQVTWQRDYPDEFAQELGTEPDRLVSSGGSCIVDPTGAFIVPPVYGEEKVIVAELDPTAILNAKALFDSVGHYSRPDIFHLAVNERGGSLVSTAAGPGIAPTA